MATQTARRPRRKGDPQLRTGRPSSLDVVVRTRQDGTAVTAREAIIELVRTALPIPYAAATVGFNQQNWCDWTRKAARARARQIAIDEGIPNTPLTEEERDHVAFLDEVEAAAATAMATDWTRLGMLAAGSIPLEVTTTTIKVAVADDGSEKVIERSTKTVRDKTLPSLEALKWRMSRRWPEVFGDRVAITGPDGGPVEVDVTAAGLVSRLRGIVDTTAAELPAGEIPSVPDASVQVAAAETEGIPPVVPAQDVGEAGSGDAPDADRAGDLPQVDGGTSPAAAAEGPPTVPTPPTAAAPGAADLEIVAPSPDADVPPPSD